MFVREWYEDYEYKLIWKELDFLSDFNKFKSSQEEGAKIQAPDAVVNYLSNHKSLHLNTVYQSYEMSNIMLVTQKLFSSGILSVYGRLNEYASIAHTLNQSGIKVGYYENGDSYEAHRDNACFTCLSYLYKTPKKFEGGSLKFVDYNIECECENNSLVIFPSYIRHQVDPIKLNAEPNNMNGRFYISQFLRH